MNADAAAAGEPDPGYEAYLIPASPTATQNVGFLVKTSRIQVESVTQERATDTFINPVTGLPELLHDRPPLVLRATADPWGADPRQVIVVVNHLRSFIDIELVDGEGVFQVPASCNDNHCSTARGDLRRGRPERHTDRRCRSDRQGNQRRHLDVHYIFNLETDGLAPGSFNLSLVAGEDPTVHLVGFTVK